MFLRKKVQKLRNKISKVFEIFCKPRFIFLKSSNLIQIRAIENVLWLHAVHFGPILAILLVYFDSLWVPDADLVSSSVVCIVCLEVPMKMRRWCFMDHESWSALQV